MNARVFLFEETKQNVGKAGAFGKVEYLFSDDSPRSALFDCDDLGYEVVLALDKAKYNPAVDYICVTGHIVAITVLTATVVSEWGRAKFLLYDAVQKTYHERELGYEFEEV